MKVILERAANAEMIEAAQYYDEQQPGLGSDFLDKVDTAVDELASDPLRFRFYRGSKSIRSIRLGFEAVGVHGICWTCSFAMGVSRFRTRRASAKAAFKKSGVKDAHAHRFRHTLAT